MLTEIDQRVEKSTDFCVEKRTLKEVSVGQFAILLFIAILVAFPKILCGNTTFFYRDFGAMWYPVYQYTRESFLGGNIPLWNPYIHCGVPFQAQMGQWYPPLLLSLFFPMPSAINCLTLLHLIWAGLGMYWLARRLGINSFAASVAGMAYAFNGVMLSSLLWISYVGCLAWLPWVVGCVTGAWKQGGRWVGKASLSAAMQVLTGMPEITILTWLVLALVWITLITKREIDPKVSVRRVAIVIILSAGISMIQMLPFFDLLSHSQRSQNTATDIWSMPLWGWANFFVPLFHNYQSPTGQWFQSGQDLLPSYYLGVTVLSLGLIAPIVARNRISILFVTLALLCWIMALGPTGILYAWVRRMMPAIGIARFPIKFAILPAFLIPFLASITVDRLRSNTLLVTKRYLTSIAIVVLLIMGALLWIAHVHPFQTDRWNLTAWNTAERAILMSIALAALFFSLHLKPAHFRIIVQLVFIAIIPFEAMTHSPNIAPTLPNSVLAPGAWQASNESAPPNVGNARVMLTPQAEQKLLFSQVGNLNLDFTSKRIGQWYNLNLLDKVPKVNGAMPLRPAYFDRIEQAIYFGSGTTIGRGLFDFLSVAAYSTPENPLVWESRIGYLPVMSAGQAPVFASDEVALRSIMETDFDPRALVYLPEQARNLVAATNVVTCSLKNVHFEPQRIESDTESSGPSVVVLSQSFYHLWKAFIDNKPAPLLRANVAFQAIPIPGGKHHLKLVYEDKNFIIGAIICLISFSISLVLCFRTANKHDQLVLSGNA